jgi:hypothetical protein
MTPSIIAAIPVGGPWGITIDNGSENTWADGAWSREEIRCC